MSYLQFFCLKKKHSSNLANADRMNEKKIIEKKIPSRLILELNLNAHLFS